MTCTFPLRYNSLGESMLTRWLHKTLGFKGRNQPSRVHLVEGPHWRVVGVKTFDTFFRCLADLVPEGSTLYIENTTFTPDVEDYLKGLMIEDGVEVARGTIWPKPRIYRIPIAQTHLFGLARISAQHAEPEVAEHMIVCSGSVILLEWYDAGFDTIYLSKEIDEDKVKCFCTKIGAKYDELP